MAEIYAVGNHGMIVVSLNAIIKSKIYFPIYGPLKWLGNTYILTV